MNIGNLRVGVEVDKTGLTNGIKSIGTETEKLSKQLSKAFAFIGSAVSITALITGINKVMKASEAQRDAVIQLNSALKNQNTFSKALSESFQKQATQLMWLTKIEDEKITSGQALAMNMGVQADMVKLLTPLILDFASAMKVDLETAFRVMGKAALGETDTLKRYGIIIDENELKTKGFSAIVDKMQKSFGGTAEALAKSNSGIKTFKITIGELSELVGDTLTPGMNQLAQAILNVGKSLVGENKRTEEQAKHEKKLHDLLVSGNLKMQDRVILLRMIHDQNQMGIEIIMKKYKVEKQGLSDLEKAELNRLAKLQAAQQKYADMITTLNKNVENAIIDGLANIMAGEQSLGKNIAEIWDTLKHIILKAIAEQLIAEKAAALGKIALSKAVTLAKNIEAYVGIPFVGWIAIAAGAALISRAFDELVGSFQTGTQRITKTGLAYLHEGEAVIPRERNPYLGKTLEPAMAGVTNNLNFNNPVFLSEAEMEKYTRKYIIPAINRYGRKTQNSDII